MNAAKPRKELPRDPKKLCPATKPDGSPCQAWAHESGWCGWHDPGRSEAEKQGWRAKGKSKGNPVKLDEPDPQWRSIEDAQAYLERTAGLVTRGEISTEVSTARRSLVEAWKGLEEIRSIRQQLEALEGLIGQKIQRTWG